jgi:hypothetical protein
MKYIFKPYLFNVINIHILHYKISQTSNILTEKSQSGHSLRDGGSSVHQSCIVSYFHFRKLLNARKTHMLDEKI